MVLTIKSPKVLDFYEKNKHIDFNTMNEMLVDIIQKITSTVTSSISVNEVKVLLNHIHTRVGNIESNINNHGQMLNMVYDSMKSHKEFYVEQINKAIHDKKEESDILNTIKETNATLIDKTIYSLLQHFPKMNDDIVSKMKQKLDEQQCDLMKENQRLLTHIMDCKETTENGTINAGMNMREILNENYNSISRRVNETCRDFLQQYESSVMSKMNESNQVFKMIGDDFRTFFDKQKNSTLKGKVSEEKLESCLVHAFPNAEIIDQSGKPQSCDYLMVRHDRPDILFENKDYANNVPNDEIKKFIRDIEYQKKHGVLISQSSGVSHKHDYQIDIHGGNIMVYVHFAHYEESKIRLACNIIDHLHECIQKNSVKGIEISMDILSEINKEYLQFIGQKKSMMEVMKKTHKDQLRMIEEFDFPRLQYFLNSKFTNVEQLSYKCEYCGVFTAKNKRALTTHQNKCKKRRVLSENPDRSSVQDEEGNEQAPGTEIVQNEIHHLDHVS